MDFEIFLVEAKIAGYAKVGETKENVLEDGGKELVYEQEEFLYRDRYYGHNPFSGEEIVWKSKNLYWSMNYYGKVLSKEINSNKVCSFLKLALKEVTKELPFRGPKTFEKEDFNYTCVIDGNISLFTGKETIYFKGKEIYVLHFHGGLISVKYPK